MKTFAERRRAALLALLLFAGGAGGAGATVDIPTPDLEALEPAVAEQLRLHQRALDEALKGEVSALEQAAMFGELGRLYHAYGLADAAAEAFAVALGSNPQDYRWHYHAAVLAAEAGKPEQAEEGFQRVLEMQPDLLPARYRLARLYRQLDRLPEADAELAAITAALARQAPSFAALLAERGELRLAQGRPREAIADLEPALAAVPGADRLHYPLGMAYRAAGAMAPAREHLARAGSAGLRYPDPLMDSLPELVRGERARLLRGQAAFRAGDFAAAAEAFREAVAAAPDSVAARVGLSAALVPLEQRAEALQQLQRAIELEPRSAAAQFNLGLLLMAEAPEQAATHLGYAAELLPEDPEVRLSLARVLKATGRPARALRHYAKAVELAPGAAEAWLEYAALLVNGALYADALATLEQAHRQRPADGNLAHALAKLLAAVPQTDLRDGERALDLARRVFEAHPTLTHGETLAAALAETGRCLEAAQLQGEAAEFARTNGPAERVSELEAKLAHYRSGAPCRP